MDEPQASHFVVQYGSPSKDDTWAEGIAMDRADQHEGKPVDIDLRADGERGRTYV
ncbi:hypothetical protein [Arthrobacter antioxidans]|uniref:hypothetical protein n=1 Tax=Arthrobacter antioxidans TaxID=2895818 RepID=UPI001FFFA2FE|nr:hypothetical protein [Arthrobacter antioxidans]